MTGPLQTRTNPYVGPRAFQQGEKLYGRDREVMQLLHLLMAERIVLLYSPSGAGKTSLIQAALIPKLQEEGFHVLPPMRVSLGPSADEDVGSLPNRYIFSLLLSLEEALPPEQRTPLPELSTLTLGEYLDRRQGVGEAMGTVLIFDQFEEILTFDPLDRGLKLEFFVQVGAALRDRRRWALFAMREEFVAGLEDAYLRPIPTRLRTSYQLGLLVRRYAIQAIQEPAKAAGLTFSDAAADKLMRDLSTVRVLQPDGSAEKRLGPHVEPVQLQVVCRRLWDLLPDGTSQIVGEDIDLLTDVSLALSGYYADQVKTTASNTRVAERTIRNWFDRKLITEQGIRGQVLEGPDQSEGLDNRAIRPLVDAHLVRAEKRRGATWFELAHDRLIEPVQASNAAWRRARLARLTRWIAVGMITLIGILAVVLTSSVTHDALENKAIATAEAKAGTAESKAGAAESTAGAAHSMASDAKSKADTAESKASAAESTAGAAHSMASDAKSKADTAESKASAAEARASTAEVKAGAAETAAVQARDTAAAVIATVAAVQETVAYLETQVASCAERALCPPPVTIAPACLFEANGEFAELWHTYRDQLGCPWPSNLAPKPIQEAEQEFRNGHMFWRADNMRIYVVYERGDRRGTYQSFPDKWSEGDPYPCEVSPPQGLFQPVRGFRVVWCHLGAEDAPIGWGLEGERGFGPGYGDPLVQDFERGLIFRDHEGTTYVLFEDGKFEYGDDN